MPNRQLTTDELETKFRPLLARVADYLARLSEGDDALQRALRRKLSKELSYLERGKPSHRKRLKKLKREEQGNRCKLCDKPLADLGPVLDRLEAMEGYTVENTRLLCAPCDVGVQQERGFA